MSATPLSSRPPYFDCNATTPPDPRIVEAMVRCMREEYGNAGSHTHSYGTRAQQMVSQARAQVAAVVAGEPADVVFTSGATEGNNLALLGLAEHGEASHRRHVISTQIEHKAVLEPLTVLRQRGFEVTLVPPNKGGWVEPASIAAVLRPDTLLVSVMHVNNETGVVQPVADVAQLLEGHEAYFHTDAAQGFGKELEQLSHPRIDMISVSGHKIFGPQGVGAMILRKRRFKRPPLRPLWFGGGQERGIRPGTLPVHLTVGLGLAAELAVREHAARRAACSRVRAALLEGLAPLRPLVNGDLERTLPSTLNVSIPGVDSDAAMLALRDVVALSNGSACTSAGHHRSHVLSAMQLEAAAVRGALRWSWCHNNVAPDMGAVRSALRRLI